MLPWLLLSCTAPDKGETGRTDTSDTHGQETGRPDSDHSGDSAHSDETDTDLIDTGWDPGTGEWIIYDLDRDRFADEGYEVLTWHLNPDDPDWYDSTFDDQDPTFYMVRPADTADAAGPVLVWFHGGTLASDEDGIGGCGEDKVLENAEKTLENEFLPIVEAMRRGWAVLIPRNDWCDYWTGLGDDDPIAPGERWGYVNVARMMDFVLDGQAGYPATGERYAWGTSAGGGAAIHVTKRYGGFSGVVADSAPSSMFLYYLTSPEAPADVFGGPPYNDDGTPSDAYDLYAEASAETLIRDEDYRVPVAVTWNTEDTLNSPGQPRSLIEALEEVYTPEGIDWFEHDFNHPAPSPYYHTQSKWPQVPWGYTGQALFDFFDGKQLLWVEAEDGCADDLADACTLGSVVTAESDADNAATFSQATYREGKGSDGNGVLWEDHVPDSVPTGVPVTATIVVQLRGLDGESADRVVGTLGYLEGSTDDHVDMTAGDMAPEGTATTDDFLHQYATTRITFTEETAGAGVLRWKVWGIGRTDMDSVIYSW